MNAVDKMFLGILLSVMLVVIVVERGIVFSSQPKVNESPDPCDMGGMEDAYLTINLPTSRPQDDVIPNAGVL